MMLVREMTDYPFYGDGGRKIRLGVGGFTEARLYCNGRPVAVTEKEMINVAPAPQVLFHLIFLIELFLGVGRWQALLRYTEFCFDCCITRIDIKAAYTLFEKRMKSLAKAFLG